MNDLGLTVLAGALLAFALVFFSSCSTVEKNIYVYNYKDGTVTTTYTTTATVTVDTDTDLDIPIMP